MNPQLHVAATPEKELVLTAARGLAAGDGDTAAEAVVFHYYPEDQVLQWVAARDFRCFCPRSNFSIVDLEQRWRESELSDAASDLDVLSWSFASSPIAFLTSPEYFEDVSPSGAFGWATLFDTNRQLRLMHSHGDSADGLAVVTAAHEAAAMHLSGHYPHQAPDVDQLISGMQSHIIEYGPDDATVMERAFSDGHWRADVVVLQERSALAALARFPDLRGVLVHPAEGTTWVEQVVALVRSRTTTEELDLVGRLVKWIGAPEMAEVVRAQGWRPAGQAWGTA